MFIPFTSYVGEKLPRISSVANAVMERLLAAGYQLEGRPQPLRKYVVYVYPSDSLSTSLCRVEFGPTILDVLLSKNGNVDLKILDLRDPTCFDQIDAYVARIMKERSEHEI